MSPSICGNINVQQHQPMESLHREKTVGYSEMYKQNYFKYLKLIKILFMYLKLSSHIGTYRVMYFLEHRLFTGCLWESDTNKVHFTR